MPGLAIALLMPIVMAAAGPPFPDRRLRVVAGIALWIMAIIGMCAAAPIIFLTDAGIYTIQSTVSTGRYTLAVIAKDYGATDEGHTDVTQICRIVPGVMLSRNLRRNASLEAPPINILSRDRVMIDGWIIDLRPMIWPLC